MVLRMASSTAVGILGLRALAWLAWSAGICGLGLAGTLHALQAISGLARDGKIVCVRLSVFAEMVKGKRWTPATLKAVGGTEGVGVAFLEETFSATTAPPEHRLHQKAVRGILKVLLPESGIDIKGSTRSRGELLDASGYAERPSEFGQLIDILDSRIRLITPSKFANCLMIRPRSIQCLSAA